MQTIDLQAIPNQKFQATLDGVAYNITIRSTADIALMDVIANGVVVATSLPCLVGQPVMPYRYLEGLGGNFVWTTASGNNPQYANFGASDILLYASAAELADARTAAGV